MTEFDDITMAKTTTALAAAALRKHGGMVAKAAADLGITRQALHVRIEKTPRLKQIVAELEEEINDIAQSNVVAGIRSGDKADSKWWLTQKAKHRGFGAVTLDEDQLTKYVGALTPAALKKMAGE